MDIEKNQDLLQHVCQVQIKSVNALADYPSFSSVYFTPSKITFTANSSLVASGVLHSKSVRLNYPGLSQQDFSKFSNILLGEYILRLKLNNNDVYEVSSTMFPMLCSTTYNIQNGHALNFSTKSPLPIKYIGNFPVVNELGQQGFDYDFNFNLE